MVLRLSRGNIRGNKEVTSEVTPEAVGTDAGCYLSCYLFVTSDVRCQEPAFNHKLMITKGLTINRVRY